MKALASNASEEPLCSKAVNDSLLRKRAGGALRNLDRRSGLALDFSLSSIAQNTSLTIQHLRAITLQRVLQDPSLTINSRSQRINGWTLVPWHLNPQRFFQQVLASTQREFDELLWQIQSFGTGKVRSSDNLSFLTFNIACMPWYQPKPRSRRMQAIRRALNELQSDVIALQEVWDPSAHCLTESITYPFSATGKRPFSLFGSDGLVTLSRYPIEHVEQFAFSRSFGIEYGVKKGALLTRIRTPIGKIDVFNVHLISSSQFIPDAWASEVRAMQLDELHSWIKTRSVSGIPMLILGDLNVDHRDPLYQSSVARLGLDTYRTHHKSKRGETFDPENNSLAFCKRKDKLRLDYVFAPRGGGLLRAIQSKRVLTAPTTDGFHLSDHYGVEARICFS